MLLLDIMVYYDSFVHLILPGDEEYHYLNYNMDSCSSIKYEADKIREERNKSLFKIIEEGRKPSPTGTSLTPDDFAEVLKKSRLK